MTRRVYSSLSSVSPANYKFKLMPYHRGYRKRKRAYGRRGYTKKRMMVRRPQRGYLRTAGFYGRFGSGMRRSRGVQVEHKFLDATRTLITVAETGTDLINSHNVVPQGNTQSQRIGRKIVIKALHVKGHYHLNSTNIFQQADQRLRLIFAVDKQTNGAVALRSQVISFGLASVEINAFRNLANLSRFHILYDRVFNMPNDAVLQDAATTGDTLPKSWGFQFTKRMNLTIEYDASATTGVISTQRTNNIFAFAIAENADNPPSVEYIFRIRYADA